MNLALSRFALRVTCPSTRGIVAAMSTYLAESGGNMVIPPFLTGCIRRIHAAIFSFWAGVMPPMPMFGRSLL